MYRNEVLTECEFCVNCVMSSPSKKMFGSWHTVPVWSRESGTIDCQLNSEVVDVIVFVEGGMEEEDEDDGNEAWVDGRANCCG